MLIILIIGGGEEAEIIQYIEAELSWYLQGFSQQKPVDLKKLLKKAVPSLSAGFKNLFRMNPYLEMDQHELCMLQDHSFPVLWTNLFSCGCTCERLQYVLFRKLGSKW